MQSLRPKTVSLRLNYEQVQHVVDGIIENRNCIRPEHLHTYDDEGRDIFNQLSEQGISVDFEENEDSVETVNSELDEAKMVLTSLNELLSITVMPDERKAAIRNRVSALETLMFG